MEYAIETLEIEIAHCNEALRVINRYLVYPEYSVDSSVYLSKSNELKKAVQTLKDVSKLQNRR